MYRGRSLLWVLIFNSCPAVWQTVSGQGGRRFVQGRWRGGTGGKGVLSLFWENGQRRAMSDSSRGVPALEVEGPHLEDRPCTRQRPQANSCLQGPTQSKWTRGSAQGAAGSVLSHTMLSAAKCAGHAPARPGRGRPSLIHRLTEKKNDQRGLQFTLNYHRLLSLKVQGDPLLL